MSRSETMRALAGDRECPRCTARYAMDRDDSFWPPVSACRWCGFTIHHTDEPKREGQRLPGGHNLRAL